MNTKFRFLFLTFATIIYCVYGTACDQILSEAKGKVSNFKINYDSRFINNDWDYGITISFTIRNIGKKGIITITPKLSCSEGEWTREQALSFDEGESRTFTYFFQEPTINADNLDGSVKVYP